jgi:hypothetical protein
MSDIEDARLVGRTVELLENVGKAALVLLAVGIKLSEDDDEDKVPIIARVVVDGEELILGDELGIILVILP